MIKVIPKRLLDGGGGHNRGAPYEIERETMKLITVIKGDSEYVAICERLGEIKYTVRDKYGIEREVIEKVGDIIPVTLNSIRIIRDKESDYDKSEQIAYLKEMIMFCFGDAIERK